MQFEKLVKSLLKENEEVPKATQSLKIINPTLITSVIKKDIEDSWEQFKESNSVANITSEYDKRILSLYKDFMDMFVPNFKLHLRTNVFGDFYRGKFVDAKFKVKYTNIEIIDLETTKPIIDLAGFAIYDFPVEIEKEKKFSPQLVPIIQAWSCPNNMRTNLDPWGDFSPEDININWIYSFLAGTFLKEPDHGSKEIKRKKFNLDMIPEKAFDLLYESSTDRASNRRVIEKELNEILEDAIEHKFEDTMKSQKVGSVISKL